ncbi:hypothetical protein TD95_001285 [Thielaviopsis punctulata]|uniref:BZIP domain-containing protein n=1 Tax=Thielaviopsis punctulata TaxID=72032 RepID=A0A0F4ZD31_9PEZI|nr:hypothetical protein TD95_001285 [Thielaviopsis punctulata]
MSMASVVSPDPQPPNLHQSIAAASPLNHSTPVNHSTPISHSTPVSASTPASAPSPATPAIPAAVQIMPSGPPKVSVTSKEWVIPPRPKPGRKPATDTPPSKRKAQNRAAQRAFRERRAARVGELEEQIEDQKQARDRLERDMQDRIRSLEMELQAFRSRCSVLENMLEKERQERIRAETSSGLIQQQQRQQHHQPDSRRQSEARFSISSNDHHPPTGLPSTVGLMNSTLHSTAPPMHNPITTNYDGPTLIMDDHRSPTSFVMSSMLPPPNAASVGAPGTIDLASLSCGGCQPDGPCACVEEALAQVAKSCERCGGIDGACSCTDMSLNPMPPIKRALSPQLEEANKRTHTHTLSASEMELDMTSLWRKDPFPPMQQKLQPLPRIVIAPKDKCGFCDTDESCCVCANPDLVSGPLGETAPEAAPVNVPAPATIQPQTSIYQAPSPPGSEASPPPMEITSTGAVKLRPFKKHAAPKTLPKSVSESVGGGCGPNGPGTCAQCKADPKSGLFCRSLAANFERASGTSNGGCCGGGGAGGGCCKSKPAALPVPSPSAAPSTPSSGSSSKPPGSVSASSIAAKAQFGLSLSCAETYKTLASHRNFDQAADEISTWLPKLRAAVRPTEGDVKTGGAMQSEKPRRLPIEVEAASIMSVLKDFDVRFQERQQSSA